MWLVFTIRYVSSGFISAQQHTLLDSTKTTKMRNLSNTLTVVAHNRSVVHKCINLPRKSLIRT